MIRKVGPRSSPEFKVECAQLVIDLDYSVRDAAQVMGVGKSKLDKWVRCYGAACENQWVPGTDKSLATTTTDASLLFQNSAEQLDIAGVQTGGRLILLWRVFSRSQPWRQ